MDIANRIRLSIKQKNAYSKGRQFKGKKGDVGFFREDYYSIRIKLLQMARNDHILVIDPVEDWYMDNRLLLGFLGCTDLEPLCQSQEAIIHNKGAVQTAPFIM